jgi:hypothetical protein
MSTIERKVWVLPEGTKVADEIAATARAAGAGEVVVGIPSSLAKLVATTLESERLAAVPDGGLLVVETVPVVEPAASLEERLAALEARIAALESGK